MSNYWNVSRRRGHNPLDAASATRRLVLSVFFDSSTMLKERNETGLAGAPMLYSHDIFSFTLSSGCPHSVTAQFTMASQAAIL
jgi:hypothetical protein